MMTRLMEYLAASLERSQARRRHRWQRTRRLGRTRFILLFVLYFWLMMVGCNLFTIWIIGASFGTLRVFPQHTWVELLFMMISCTIGIYFAGAYAWRHNERRYGNQDQTP